MVDVLFDASIRAKDTKNNHFFKGFELCCQYINNGDVNSLRQCSKYLNKLITPIYFSIITINLKCIDVQKLCKIIEKYKLKIKGILSTNYSFEILFLHFKNIKSMTFYNYFQSQFQLQLYEFNLLASLEYLEFDQYFNKSLKGIKWPNLKTLVLGNTFNQPIEQNNLPSILEILKFGTDFNQPLGENTLPKSLKRLQFGFYFNYLFTENVLPVLEYLEFGRYFNHSFNASIKRNKIRRSLSEVAPSLKTLECSRNFTIELDETALPRTLETLIFNGSYKYSFRKNVIPNGLKHLDLGLKFNKQFNNVTSTLESLKMSYYFNNSLSDIMFPIRLQKLVFGVSFNRIIKQGELPNSLTYLDLGTSFNQVITKGVLPEGLLHLEFGHYFDESIFSLPSTLKHLTFRYRFGFSKRRGYEYVQKKLLYCDLPEGLLYLDLGYYYDEPIVFPSTIQDLKLSYCFDQKISIKMLPIKLKYLTANEKIKKMLEKSTDKCNNSFYFKECYKNQNTSKEFVLIYY